MRENQLLAIVSILWVASELVVAFAKHARSGESRQDRGSLTILWMAIGGAVFGASAVRFFRPTRMPPDAFWIGLALMIAGIIVRAIAIATLWRHFSVDVAISRDHELIDRGIYGVLRHPAYSGSLLSFLGLGICFRNWLSVAILVLVSAAAFAYRIHVEERALSEHFGDAWRAYAARTKRLVPGVF